MHFLMNSYTHEQNFAFLPGYSWACQSLLRVFSNNYETTVVALVLINKVLFWMAVRDLQAICKAFSLSNQATHNAIMFFIYNPALVFFHSVYSESLYVFLTFKAVNFLLNHKNGFMFTCLLMLATLVRSTGIFLLPAIGVPLLVAMFRNLGYK